MGTASFSVGSAANVAYNGVLGSGVKTSGAFTTSTSAANIEDAGGDISLVAGDVLQVYASVAMRVAFGGVAATASTGHYIPAGMQKEFACDTGGQGFVSIVDVA